MWHEKIRDVHDDKSSHSVHLAGAGASISLDNAFMPSLQCVTHFLLQSGFDFSSIPEPGQPVAAAPIERLGFNCWRI